jgi:hypothetical protein
MRRIIFIIFFLGIMNLDAFMFHRETVVEEWIEENIAPFDELMISWNSLRPCSGKYLFYVSVKTDEWSEWLLYADWGSEGQSSFQTSVLDGSVRVYQDALEVLHGKKATGFQIKVASVGSALLKDIRAVHVYTNSDRTQDSKFVIDRSPIHLSVKGLSQMVLNHPRCKDLCSPTSTTAVVRYLLNQDLDPVQFAQNSWDRGFNIYGNWVFNVAQASSILGSSWNCWVERLSGFHAIHHYLDQGMPVIVSVRGPLKKSAQPYSSGHLIVVIGCDEDKNQVYCMDPAFASDSQTYVCYDLTDFIQAWNRKGRIAYVFTNDIIISMESSLSD